MTTECNGHCACNVDPSAVAAHYHFSSAEALIDFLDNAQHIADTHCGLHANPDTHRNTAEKPT